MRWRALATDYDNTIARDSAVSPETEAELRRVSATGRKLVLVTGRTQDCFDGRGPCGDIMQDASVFDLIVAENGGTLYNPRTRSWKLLAPALPDTLLDELRRRGVEPWWQGLVMFSTTKENHEKVWSAIQDLGLKYTAEFNRQWVMYTPVGVSKATGLRAALRELKVRPAETVGLGDGENDLSFMRVTGLAVAVGDAEPSLKRAADLVMPGAGPEGARQALRSLALHDLQVAGAGRAVA
jgi:HAD superfamily hydrolase (TIGR01484 family)